MFWIEMRRDWRMTIPLRLPGVGVTVAVGLPKIVRSVLPEIMTVSLQVPITEMEFGPAAGRLASAAEMLVNAGGGVPPLQSTTAPAACAAAGTSVSNRMAVHNFKPIERNFSVIIFSLRPHIGELIAGCGVLFSDQGR